MGEEEWGGGRRINWISFLASPQYDFPTLPHLPRPFRFGSQGSCGKRDKQRLVSVSKACMSHEEHGILFLRQGGQN